MLFRSAIATSFTSGEVIRKANVTPSGIPPFTKPINKGIDEQLQNGVTAPNRDAKTYCNPKSLRVIRKLRSLSIGKYAFIIPIMILIRKSRINILIVSYKKKFKAAPKCDDASIPNKLKTIKSAKSCIINFLKY